MRETRVDTKNLKDAVHVAAGHLDQAAAALKPYLVVISDAERASTPRTRDGFPDAGRTLARAAANHPEMVAASGFDAEAVVEDLDNVAVLAPVAEKVARLGQLLADTKLTWLAEAWVPALALYALAKVRSKADGALRTVVDPLAAIFANRRGRASKPPAELDR
jgi:hypothetical protein